MSHILFNGTIFNLRKTNTFQPIRKLKIMILWDTLIRRLQLIKLNKYHQMKTIKQWIIPMQLLISMPELIK